MPRTLCGLAPARLRSPLRPAASPSWWSCCCSARGSAGATRTGCRGRCATRSSATATPRSSQEAIDRVHDTYYRQIPKSALADDAIAGVVAKLGDRFSNYFDPGRVQALQGRAELRVLGRRPAGLAPPQGPARRCGLRRLAGQARRPAPGRRHRRRRRARPGRAVAAGVRRPLVKGPPGSQVRLTWVRDGKRYTKTVSRSTVTVPVVASQLRSADGCQVGVVRLSQFSSGAHAEVYAALRKLQKRGAKVFVLDLRDNGGGLVSEAQLIASAFLKDGPIVTTRGRAVKEQTLRATGDPVVPTAPMSVLVNGDTASASEIVTGALQDRDRAKVVGTETFGKGVFQEVLELSNGGALDITAGQYFTPKGRNLGGKGVSTGQGDHPRRPGQGRPQDARPTRGSTGRWPSPAPSARPDRRPAARRPARAARPLPRRRAVLPARPAGDGRALARRAPRAPGAAASQPEGRALQDRARARAPRRRPRRHRGADARSRPAALVPGRGRARRPGRPPARRRPPRPHRAADLHHRPGHRARLRRRDLLRGPRRRALARVGPHRRRLGLRAPRRRRSTARPTGARPRSTCRARSSRCCPRRCPTTPARCARASSAWRSPSSSSCAAPRRSRRPSTARSIRSDERLDYDRVDRIFAGAEAAEEPWAQPLAAARAAAAALQARRESRGALAVESVEPEFAFDRRGHLVEAVATVQTESHRLIEHLMIAANEAVATLLVRALDPGALPRPRAPRAAVGAAPGRPARVAGRRHAAGARAAGALAGGRHRRRSARCSSTSTCAAPATAARRSRRSCCARSSRRATRR